MKTKHNIPKPMDAAKVVVRGKFVKLKKKDLKSTI